MALTPEELAALQAQIVALRAAIGGGVQTVKYSSPSGSREVTYPSVGDMLKALAKLESTAAAASGSASRYRLARTRDGFGRRGRGSFRRNE